MLRKSFVCRPLILLLLLSFMGQTISVAAANHQGQTSKSESALSTDMDHAHHAIKHPMNHDMDAEPVHTVMDCCDQQCDCDMAHCSIVFALIASTVDFLHYSSVQSSRANLSLVTNTLPPLYRPPITR